MMKSLLCVLLITCAIFPQHINDVYKKVERKLSVDKKYLNIFTLEFKPTNEDLNGLTNIPRFEMPEPYSFKVADNITYNIVFLKEVIEIDTMTILYIKEIVDKSVTDENLFGGSGGPQIDTNMVLRFTDIQELYENNFSTYSKLYNILVRESQEIEPSSLLGINVDQDFQKSRGISGLNNQDFLNYMRINSIHRYPPIVDDTKTSKRSRRGQKPAVATDYQIDASFSHVSFFHPSMDLGFSTISAELGFGSKVLGIHPWQSMTMSTGIRALVSIGGEKPNLNDDYVIDARLMGRLRINTSGFAHHLPFLFINKPLLNVGSGVVFDFATTRAYGLPFFNLYLSTGAVDVSNPFVKIGKPDSSFGYFTFKQWEASMSFYWNSSEELTMRFRMDVGIGNYDVYEAKYYQGVSRKLVYNQIQPMLKIHLNFSPKNNDFFGTSFKLFDNHLWFDFWIKLFELDETQNFRFESQYISAPMFRGTKPWEMDGATSIVQVRYRYGF